MHHSHLLLQEPGCPRAQLLALDLPPCLCRACVFHVLLQANDSAHQEQGDRPIQRPGGPSCEWLWLVALPSFCPNFLRNALQSEAPPFSLLSFHKCLTCCEVCSPYLLPPSLPSVSGISNLIFGVCLTIDLN